MKNLMIQKPMNSLKIFLAALFCFSGFSELAAQNRIPREYTNPDEIISFDRRTTFPEAVDILNGYAQDYQEKFIVDRSGYTGEIGVSLPAMHWRDAMDYILRFQNLTALEAPEYYEITTREDSGQASGERASAGDGDMPQIDTRTREVRINATFFEGNKRALREIGVDWSTLTNAVPENIGQFVNQDQNSGSGGGNSGGRGGQQEGSLPATEFGGSFVNVNSRGAQSVSQNVFNSLINFGSVAGVEVQALFSAFEADNLGKILATPSVKVLNGEEGRIQVGQDISIKQRDFAGNVTDQFFSTGTILTVHPQIVTSDDTTLIYLELEAERSTAQPDPVSTVINKQQASTHALLLDGESTVIAGLYRTEESEVRRGIPILKDLPGWFLGLKYLFGYNSTDIQESELIILLQAELEKPIPARASRAYRSQRNLLEGQQETHRTGMDYISPLSPEGAGVAEPAVLPQGAPGEEEKPVETEPVKNDDFIRPAEENEEQQEKTGDTAGVSAPETAEERTVREEPESLTNAENLEFFVVGATYSGLESAEQAAALYRADGFDPLILYRESSGYYFVAYSGFSNLSEAVPYVRHIQHNSNSEAWVLRAGDEVSVIR